MKSAYTRRSASAARKVVSKASKAVGRETIKSAAGYVKKIAKKVMKKRR